jgi:diamine N-acetyltransferase
MVTLREINTSNFDECIGLAVDESQSNFVAGNTYSLAQAWLFPQYARPFAIYNNDTMVGFLMLDLEGLTEYNSIFLWRMMVDKRYQGKGYGKAAMQEAIKHVVSEYNPETFRTSIVPGNDGAERLYKNLGFMPNGEVEHGETVMVLELRVGEKDA